MMFLHRLRVHLIPLYFIFYSGANSNSQTLAAFYELRPADSPIILTPHSQIAVTMPPSPSLGAVEMLDIVIDPVLCPYKYDESSMMGFFTSSLGRKKECDFQSKRQSFNRKPPPSPCNEFMVFTSSEYMNNSFLSKGLMNFFLI